MRVWLKVMPNDTLFFRSGRPFSMGEDTWSDSLFPPYPSTIYGTIRTFLINVLGGLDKFYRGEMRDILGTPEEKGNLYVKSIYLMFTDNILFYIPFDILFDSDDGYASRNISCGSEFISAYPLHSILVNDSLEVRESVQGFINSYQILRYIKGSFSKVSKKDIYHLSDILAYEPKIGIKIDKATKTSKDEYLYSINMIRTKNSYFVVEVSGIDDIESYIPNTDIILLGGESKTTKIEIIKDDEILQEFEALSFPNINFYERKFKLYFATPSIFKNGWLPGWINPSTLEGDYNGIKVRLISCSIGKRIKLGGWDLAKKKPKRSYYAIPAGSVYYFELLNDVPDRLILETFHLKNLSDIYPEQGYGKVLVASTKSN